MLKFVIRRVVWTIPVLLLVILMTFVMMRQIKGNPFQVTERPVPESIQRNLERKFNLDKPTYMQYLLYVKGVFTFDLGPSLVQRNQTVNDVVKEHYPTSLQLGALAMAFALIFGVPLGILAALRHNSVFDYVAMAFSNIGFSIPHFLLGTLFIYWFALKLGTIPLTYFARLVRGTMVETLQQDYIRTAKAKGLRYRRVVGLHVLRNSLIPVVTATGPLLGYIITGSFITEYIFSIPGIGKYYVNSVTSRDYSVTMGITVLLSIIIIVANMVVDILYGFLDPRTRDERS